MAREKTETVALFGLPIANVTAIEAVAQIEQLILSGSTHQVATANLDFVRNALRDTYLQQIICDCSLVVPDGAPIVWASKLFGKPLQQRVAGVDLVPRLAQLSADRGYGIFVLGSTDENSERAMDVLRLSYPKMNVVGRYSPEIRPLDEMDDDEILRRIEEANPELLLLAFGNPKQEKWIHRNRGRLKVPVAIGIGGSLDIIAGSLQRAPLWMQKTDLEWVFRMAQEPRRLLPRYVKDAAALLRYLPLGLLADALQPRRSVEGETVTSVHGSTRVVSLPASLCEDRCKELEREVETTVKLRQSLVVDLSRTTRVEADGLGSLLEARRIVRSAGKTMWVTGMNRSVRRLFEYAAIKEMIPAATTALQAVRFAGLNERSPAAGDSFGAVGAYGFRSMLAESGRWSLVDQLYRGYGESGYVRDQIRAFRVGLKRYNWIMAFNGAKFFKRTMDIAISSVALLVLFPMFLIVALIIHLEDGGPALFWQTRVGLWGQEFRFPKFRSMVFDAEQRKMELLAENHHGSGITFKMRRDPRVTRIGAIIRKLSIDEFPQLWCVLHGEMSLVGPRPPMPYEVARYTLQDRRRLDVKPGLTCIWQVSGRGELAFDQQVMMDMHYIENHSILLDITLIFKTIPVIFTGHGAY
jgi:N-acetylglucosaminyldiphosphoundecaprenol N-acetyl-beta-D-mannosaminyltransferase